jgi:NADH:ubiquinone oxidoreductase subunit 6 (subunit J)
MIGMILFGIPAAIIAGVKGFKPLRWLLALGIIGFIVVLCLSSAKAQGISPEESAARASKANSVGAWMCGINLVLGVIALLVLIAAANS